MAYTDVFTPAWLKERYLFGVDLTDDAGNPFPDSLFNVAITSAVETVAAELDLVLDNRATFTDRVDCYTPDMDSFFLTRLRKRPVWEVSDLSIQFGDLPAANLPASFALAREPLSGQVQIVPGRESSFTLAFSGAFAMYGFESLAPRRYTPGWFSFTYSAGYDGTTKPYPADIQDAIGLLAAMLPLDTAGDLIVGAGIASKSMSMDGLSTSINTTSSATNSGYGARVIQYMNRYKKLLESMRSRYKPIPVGVM